MAIKIKCPKCGTEYNVRDERAGQTGRCKCGNLISIPSAAETSEDSTVTQRSSEELAAMLEKARGRSSLRRWKLIAAGMALCIGGAALAGFTLIPGPPQPAFLAIGLGLIVLGIGALIAASR
jgi:hypothetical protein